MRVDPGKEDAYIDRHQPIWEELEQTLLDHGVKTYSIFLDRERSDLFAYAEIEDLERWKAVAETDVCRRWWDYMAPLMPTNPNGSPVSGDLEEVFHIEIPENQEEQPMSDKVLVIISTSDAEKARTGMMYAVNAVAQEWMTDVKLIIFGPAQHLFLEDQDLQERVALFGKVSGVPVACRFIADRDGITRRTEKLGMDVQPVGTIVSEHIKKGYVPMVW